MRGSDDHELSILIRLGNGGRAGRGPSNVSTMIIRPPQHGQRRAGETSSAWLSALLRGHWGSAPAVREQLPRALDVLKVNRAGQQAVVADAVAVCSPSGQVRRGPIFPYSPAACP
jgi:hypothetical protein